MIDQKKFNASFLWRVEIRKSSPAGKMNLSLIPKPESIPGFGIYALSYNDSDWGDRVIYLGKFAGGKNRKSDDALSGDVRQRWFKHIGTATLLLSNLKMASSKHYFDQKTRALEFYEKDAEFLVAFKNSFLDLDEKTANLNIFIKGADLQVSKNRLAFAIQNLKKTNFNNPNKLHELYEIVSRFTCHYWRWTSSEKMTKTSVDPELKGGRGRRGVESEIIKKYSQQLPMNREYAPERTDLDGFYHYNPNSLIKVDGDEYMEFSKFISKQLHNKFQKH